MQTRSGFDKQVIDHQVYQPAANLVEKPRFLEIRVSRPNLLYYRAKDRHIRQIFDQKQAGPETVVNIVGMIGDIVGKRRHLCLHAWPGMKREIVLGSVFTQCPGQFARLHAIADKRPVMLGDTLQSLPGQVQSVEFGVSRLQRRDYSDGLPIMVKTAIGRHHVIERFFASVTERRVAQIMRQRQRFREILVQRQRPGDRARDLRDLQAVRQAGSIVIALVIDENLGLVLQPAECAGVNDPVPVALVNGSGGTFELGMRPPP